MQKIALGLKKLETELDLILTSPYLRAADTAQIVRDAFDLDKKKLVETEYLSPVGSSDRLINLINEKYAFVENIALVGHEPALGHLVSMLISGDPNLSLTLKKVAFADFWWILYNLSIAPHWIGCSLHPNWQNSANER